MHPIDILLIEDNEGDILLTKEALLEGDILKELQVVKDGWEALLYLEKKENYKSAKTPDLILLDINLPKLNGFEVLKKIRSAENTKNIPVVILSTSTSDNDIKKSIKYHANYYISKPIDADGYPRVIRSIKKFWLSNLNQSVSK
tara:strand:+ start:89157 stop:89588 length:432 start_codon:yes stop_codon:yes gene_type:complete